jgi:hypothetical protein
MDSASEWQAIRQDAASTLSRYVQFDTTNPPGDEKPTAGWPRGQLLRLQPRTSGLDIRDHKCYNLNRCGDDRLRRGRLIRGSKPGCSDPVNNGAQILSANENTWMPAPMAAFDMAAVPVVA